MGGRRAHHAGRSGPSSTGGAGSSTSTNLQSAGHSSSIEEPELQRIREELIEKYSSKSIEYFYKYYKPTRSQCMKILDAELKREGKSQNTRKQEINQMLTDRSITTKITDLITAKINPIVEEIETNALVS
uniref:Uncharacterized protein n=1 Tax=Meloidogyne floridensis TaxID=298350 RepID=A0A915PGC8_9BILA